MSTRLEQALELLWRNWRQIVAAIAFACGCAAGGFLLGART